MLAFCPCRSSHRVAIALLAVLAYAIAPGTAAAVPITVLNPSFESPPLAPGGFIQPATDWSITGAGAFRAIPGVHYSGQAATDGLQVAFVAAGGVMLQVLAATLQPNTTYTLLVDVGDRRDVGLTEFAIGLYAGGNLLAEDASTPPPNDGFLTSDVVYVAASGDPLLGQPLEIRLGGPLLNGEQVNYDNVRLDAVSVSVPEPATGVGLGVALLSIAMRRRSR